MPFRWSRRLDSGIASRAVRPGAVRTMRLWALVAASACTVTRIPAAPQPAGPSATPAPKPRTQSVPETSTVLPTVRTGGPWQFAPAAGTYSYVITTDGQIVPDSAAPRVLPPTAQRVTLAIFSTGDVHLVDPPAPAPDAPCDAAAALATRALEIIPRVPATLSVGMAWTDSATTTGCRGPIPATTHTWSRYTVLGDSVFEGGTALQVQRSDSIVATGEGAQGQHRITLAANGTATTQLFLDVTSGRFLAADEVQQTAVSVGTSGRVEHFVQHVHQRATLAPPSPPTS